MLGILNTLFKIPIKFVADCLKFTKKKKNEILCMLFQKNQMCFNEPDYVTVRFVMNIMTPNRAKMAHKMFLSYYYLAFVRNGLLQAHNDKCCSLVKLLWIYFCYFILLNHGQTVLKHIFFQKLYVIGKISIR